MNHIAINLKKGDKERLNRLALSYGLSLPEFSYKILTELSEIFPHESLKDYKNPKKLKASLVKALDDFHHGRIQTNL